MNIIVTSFYKFVPIDNYHGLQPELLQKCKDLSLKGTILLAHEGVNGSIAGTAEQIKAFYEMFNSYDFLQNITYKENTCANIPFSKMKIKLKKEIVALGQENISMENKGEYVKAQDWDQLIDSDDVVLIDTRNDYEYQIGSFAKAINPNTENFRDFPKWFEENEANFQGKKIAMFCTGGIRCEKSTAYVKTRGFDEVYHLEGGIINYFEESKNKNNKWHGQCFVFDDRCAIDDNMMPSELKCHNCDITLKRNEIELRKNQKQFYCADCFNEIC